MRRRKHFLGYVSACIAALSLLLAGVNSAGASRSTATRIHRGGTLHILVEAEAEGAWSSLDPTTTNFFEYDYLNAIYGQLFEQGTTGNLIPDMASGYSLSNGDRVLTITLRPGIKFTDGTPFDAQAVAFNIRRDLEPKYACRCDAEMPVQSITTPNKLTVVLHLSRPYAPIAEAFIGTPPNWIASPTALRKEGAAKFALHPVGAGPFKVYSNNPGVQLVLRRNQHYWEAGHPYLNYLVFSGVGTNSSGLEALYAGNDQVFLIPFGGDFAGIPSIRSHGFKVYVNPAVTPLGGVFNTLAPPFNNIKARLAVSYATNPAPIDKAFFAGHLAPTQAPTGTLHTDFPEPKVPGYPSYDPAKAKALVKQLGGLSFTITTYTSSTLLSYSEALQAEWARVGIHATIDEVAAATIGSDFQNHTWQMIFAGVGGGTDPALFGGLSTYYSSSGTESGVHDPTLDTLLADGAAAASFAARAAIYKKVFKRIATQDYALVLGLEPVTNVVGPKIGGWVRWAETPWQNIYLKS